MSCPSYGVSDYQSFASYGYAAAMHTDNDDTATMGWVSACSGQVNEILFMNNMPIKLHIKVLDDESNFVYAQFKVILELDVDTH